MKRWHEETAHMDRQLAIVERWIIWHKKRGYYRKRKALDCGQARCFGCHSDKYPKREKTRKEQEADLNFREEIAEYNESRENPGSR